MRKLSIAILAVALISSTAYTQEDEPTNKEGKPLLPDQGDIGVGVNLVPMFNWVGNMFNGSANTNFAGQNKFVNIFNNTSLYGKYMLTKNSAIRASFGLNFSNFTNKNYVIDDNANNPDSVVTDQVNVSSHNFTFAVGYEMRRGGRLQGFFGGDLVVTTGKTNNRTYNFGNAMGTTNASPTSTTWNPTGTVNAEGNRSSRPVFTEGQTTFGIGLRPFVGMEFYVIPKLSVGLEFGYNVMYNTASDFTVRTERIESGSGNLIKTDVKNAGSRRFTGGTDNLNGAIFMMFYF